MASIGILGSQFAGDFFLGIDIMVLSMLVNFLLMSVTLLAIGKRNPGLSKDIKVVPNLLLRRLIAASGVLMISGFLVVHIVKDLTADVSHWYFHSTPVWLIVMTLGSLIYFWQYRRMKNEGVDLDTQFKKLPEA